MTPSLPVELWEHIIDYLSNDQQSLSSCALVCKGWVDPARFHLFASIAIIGYVDYSERRSFLASPNIAPRIRRATIHRNKLYFAPLIDSTESVKFASTLGTVLPALVGLKHLCLNTDPWALDLAMESGRSSIAGIFPQLTSIHIVRIGSDIWQDLMRMISTSILLRELTTENAPRMLPVNPIVDYTWPALQSLKMDDRVLPWLPSGWQSHPTQTITTLELHILSGTAGGHAQTDRFLQTLGACLLHLTFNSFTRMDIYPSLGKSGV